MFHEISVLFLGSVVEYEKNPIGKALDHVYGIAKSDENTEFKNHVTDAIQTLEECFSRYK